MRMRFAADSVGQSAPTVELMGWIFSESLDAMGFSSVRMLVAELGQDSCKWCEYCQPCEQGVLITPTMSYPIIARSMSGRKAAGFAAKRMESVRRCIECGECTDRCPQNRPIPEMLKKLLALYEEHQSEKS
ncbi:MAG: 4Fe-4S dicluster domain-containing protein [Syntrophobacteraceae bacterium]